MLIVLILVICIALVTDEKDKRLFLLLKATPGGAGRTIAAKMGAMALCVFAVSFVLFLSNILFAELSFGLGDMTRSIQSVPDLMISTMRINLLQFTCLFFIVKTLGLIIVGLLVMLIALHSKHGIIALLITTLFGAVNIWLSTILVTSSWNWLRFLNIAALVRPYEVLRRYFNINFFGHPVGLIPVFLMFAAILSVLAIFAVYFSYTKKRSIASSKIKFSLPHLSFNKWSFPASWRWYEFRKIAFTNKALLILIVFIAIQIFSFHNAAPPSHGFEHNHIRSFLLANQGEPTEEAEHFILTQMSELDKARTGIDVLTERFNNGEIDMSAYFELRRPYDRTLIMENVINTLYERLNYVRETPDAVFVYDRGYVELFGLANESAGLTSGMVLLMVLIFALCGVFPIEYKTGMYKVLNGTRRGHFETIRMKFLMSGIFALCIFISAYLPDLLYIGQHYGFSGITLPLASIPPTEIGSLPIVFGSMPIWGYLVLLLLTRLLVCIGLAIIILAISQAIRHNLYTVLCAMGVLLAPLLFHTFGITFLDGISFYRLITTNGLFNIYPLWQTIVQCALFLAICAFGVWFIFRRFGKSNILVR